MIRSLNVIIKRIAGAAGELITHVAHASLHQSPIPWSFGSSPFLSFVIFFVYGDGGGINKKVLGRQARQLYRFKTQARTKDGETR
jgi:hypothetical protein